MSVVFNEEADILDRSKVYCEGIGTIDFGDATNSGNENFLYSFNVLDFDVSTVAVIETWNRPAQVDAYNSCNQAKVLLVVSDIPNRFVKNAVIDALQQFVDEANDKSISTYNNNYKENK